MQSDMKKKGKVKRIGKEEGKVSWCAGDVMNRGPELRVGLVCWRNTEDVRVALVEEGREVIRGERRWGHGCIVMASLYLSPRLCWALESCAGFSPQSHI